MSVIDIKTPTERDPGPYPAKRACPDCGALLSRSNPGPLCAPCNGGDWDRTKVTVLHTLDDLADVLAA